MCNEAPFFVAVFLILFLFFIGIWGRFFFFFLEYGVCVCVNMRVVLVVYMGLWEVL